MMPHLRYAAAALALVAGAAPALAQTVITRGETIVTAPRPLRLSSAQRTIIYRTIVREPLVRERFFAEAPPPAEEIVVGSPLPPGIEIAPLPPTAVIDVPAVRPYRYAFVDERVLLVDPLTGIVVGDLRD